MDPGADARVALKGQEKLRWIVGDRLRRRGRFGWLAGAGSVDLAVYQLKTMVPAPIRKSGHSASRCGETAGNGRPFLATPGQRRLFSIGGLARTRQLETIKRRQRVGKKLLAAAAPFKTWVQGNPGEVRVSRATSHRSPGEHQGDAVLSRTLF